MCKYSYSYSTKSQPDKSFCLNDRRWGGKIDLVFFISCLILVFCLLERNLDFINVLRFYYVENKTLI